MSTADHAGKIRFSYKKYYSYRNKINRTFAERFHSDMMINAIAQALYYGDTQPCFVVSLNPLRVAAYSDEMDAVIMLDFPVEFVEKYKLQIGSRLASSNLYQFDSYVAPDIFPGPKYLGQYSDFMPVIQLFVGKNNKKNEKNVSYFSEETWELVNAKANEYLLHHKDMVRPGLTCFQKKRFAIV